MRTKTSLVLLFMLISVMLMSCQSHNEASNTDRISGAESDNEIDITQVSISNAKGFSNVNTNFFTVYEDKESLKVFKDVVSSAVRVQGIVDLVAPEFDFEIVYNDGNKQVYHLWVGESGKKSTIMKVEDTHTIYTVPAAITDKLIELLEQ